jgi:HEAT repeat protein
MENVRNKHGLVVLLALGLLAQARADRTAVPLNGYERLGQRFSVTQALETVSVVVPSWLDAEGGLTLSLWDSPARTRSLARKTFTDIADNALVALSLPKALPAGTYYWEVSGRTGRTRVGLYADEQKANSQDCAYLDGAASPGKRFLFKTAADGTPPDVGARMVAELKSDAPDAVRVETARRLAILGSPGAVDRLAELLRDERASHLARSVLEAMADPAAGAVLREQLADLRGLALIGVINSIGERRDAAAVSALGNLLKNSDPNVTAAAAGALGKIGTPEAADALLRVAPGTREPARSAILAGRLDCAFRLAAGGDRERAFAIFERLRDTSVPTPIRSGAARGVLVNAPAGNAALLVKMLRSDDPADLGVALWVVQRELPGEAVTRAVAAELPRVTPERRLRLIKALCSRGDASALTSLLAMIASDEVDVRAAVLSGLAGFPDDRVVPALVKALGDPNTSVADAAESVLAGLEGAAVDAAVVAMIRDNRKPVARALRIAGARHMHRVFPLVVKAVRGDDPVVRTVAAKVAGKLAEPSDLPVLLELLATETADTPVARCLEAGALAVCRRDAVPDAFLARVTALLPAASPTLAQALMRLLREIGGRQALEPVLDAVRHPDETVRAGAVRVLADWKGAEAAADLLRLAREAEAPAGRLLCLRGYIRLAGADGLPAGQRLLICKQAARLVKRREDKVLLLGMVGRLGVPEALDVATPFLADPEAKGEAAVAVLSVAERLETGPDAGRTVEALQTVVQNGGDPAMVKRAQGLLTRIRGK